MNKCTDINAHIIHKPTKSIQNVYTNAQKIVQMYKRIQIAAALRAAQQRIKTSTTQGWGDARTPEPEGPDPVPGLVADPVRGAQALGRGVE